MGDVGLYRTQVIMEQIDWEKARVQAAIAAMPIANCIVDGFYGSDYHGNNETELHSIEMFTKECVSIADALIEELKKGK